MRARCATSLFFGAAVLAAGLLAAAAPVAAQTIFSEFTGFSEFSGRVVAEAQLQAASFDQQLGEQTGGQEDGQPMTPADWLDAFEWWIELAYGVCVLLVLFVVLRRAAGYGRGGRGTGDAGDYVDFGPWIGGSGDGGGFFDGGGGSGE